MIILDKLFFPTRPQVINIQTQRTCFNSGFKKMDQQNEKLLTWPLRASVLCPTQLDVNVNLLFHPESLDSF